MRIAMLLHKSVEHDSRVRRSAHALAEAGHEVTVLHLPRRAGELDGELDGFQVCSVTPPAWVRRRLPTIAYRLIFLAAFVRGLRRVRPDAVHAHDVAMLAPGWLGARTNGARLVYDSHELATGVPYRDLAWARAVALLERLVVPRCDRVITVSEGIAERLQALYGLRERPVVVRNFPDPRDYRDDAGNPDLRAELGLSPQAPLALHLGAAAMDRGCETLVRALAQGPLGLNLLFLGADADYAERLGRLARSLGSSNAERVHFLAPVAVDRVLACARQADVGISLLEDTCENHRLALPNKVFEYLAAGTSVVASDLPELRRTLEGQPGALLVNAGSEAAVATALGTAIEGERPSVPSDFRWSTEAARLVACYSGLAPLVAAERGKALVLVRNGVSHDARVMREAGVLDSMGFETTVAGVVTEGTRGRRREVIDRIEVVRLDPGSGLRRALDRVPRRAPGRQRASAPEAATAATAASGPGGGPGLSQRLRRLATTADYYRRGIGTVRRLRPDLIHANDYNTAWIGVAGKLLWGSRLVYDSHELWPDRNLRPEPRPWLLACEALFVRVADEVLTTSPGYAQVLARRYRIERPRLVRNLPDWSAGPAGERREQGDPLAVYFGALTRNRGLATALRALALIPELQMRFVGPEAWGYRTELESLAQELGVAGRLELRDPVSPREAPSVLADADLGLALIEPTCLSYRMTLPNKLYEYVAAGLPVLASEVPVLAGEVRDHGLGLVADPADPEAVAAAIRGMLDPQAAAGFRRAASALAGRTGWAQERHRLEHVYASLGSTP